VRVTLEAKVQQLTSDAAEAQAHVAALETKLATSRETMDILSQAQVQHEQAIGLVQTQLTEALAKCESLQTELDSAQETIAERDASLAAAEHEASKVARFREEMLASERAMGVLRAQMVVAAEQASRKQNELQNALQAARQFLDELRAEYEDYADTTKAEFELYKASKAHEIRQLRMEFDRFKTAQFEDNRQLLVEQQSITHALQTQYEEYRKSVEQIYVVESAKLEDKLHSQMNKYEAEIRFIIKCKDAAYLDMVANKDAKIMNLIEGANMQVCNFCF
jgi:chromosome segregation ATPase